MQFAFAIILIVSLVVGLAVLAWMGLSQRRRSGRLERIAHEMGMRFARVDPFGLTRRYSGFLLCGAGHSPRAENVIHGRRDGWRIRLFDYYFEVGHGQRRLGRRYSVIVADTDMDIPDVLMWSQADTEHVPLAVRGPSERVGQWIVPASRQARTSPETDFAVVLAEAFDAFADEPVDLQVDRRSVMVFSADRWKPSVIVERIAGATAGLGRLREGLRLAGPTVARGQEL